MEVGSVPTVTATLLPLPDDPVFTRLIESWPGLEPQLGPFPRSKWLRMFEDALRPYFPAASSRDLSLTARHYAPFPLAAGHDVP